MKNVIEQYLCGEAIEESVIMPKHFEYFFNEKELMKVLILVTVLSVIGGIAVWV